MLAKDRVFAIRAGTYTSSDIKEASFNYGYISGDTFKPGGTVAGSAKLTFTSIITTFNKLDKIYPEIGLLVGDSYEWVAMGEYFVNDISIDRNRNTTELDLMDGMFKLNQPYVSDLTYPAQIRDVIREICVKTGVELETDNLGLRAIQRHIEAKADKKDITFREVLSQAIQLLGFSAFFNRRGKLEVRGLTDSRITVTADNYFLHGLTKSEIQYQIAGITCKKDKETLTVGLRTGRSLELENSFMNQNLLDDLYYDLKEIKYYPFSLDWQGHLKLDVGQWVTLKTNKNETYKVPVLSQSFNFRGGLKSKISADSKAGNDTQYSYKGFLTKQIEQMSTQIDAEIQQQLEYANAEFDRKAEEYRKELDDDLEKSKAAAELYADNIKQEISNQIEAIRSQFRNNEQEQDRQIEESLRRAGASTDLANTAKVLAEQAKQETDNAKIALSTQSQALLNQAQLQTELAERIATVEATATGTKATIQDLTKTIDATSGMVASVSGRTKIVEDELGGLKTKYTSLNQTLDAQTGQVASVSQKTAQLESGLEGVTQRFESLQVGGRNYFSGYQFNQEIPLGNYQGTGSFSQLYNKLTYPLREANGKTFTISLEAISPNGNTPISIYNANGDPMYFNFNGGKLGTVEPTWKRFSTTVTVVNKDVSNQINPNRIEIYARDKTGVKVRNIKVELGNMVTDWSPAPEDQQSYADTKIAEYKNTVDGQFVNLQTQVNGKANLTDFQRVQTTSQLYERIIGSTEDAVREKVARMVMADSLFQTEVGQVGSNAELLSRVANGLSITTNPTFELDTNKITAYNNARNGTVVVTKQSNVGSSQPNGKPHRLMITHTGAASPGLGGFYSSSWEYRANTEYAVDFVAMLPIGYRLELASNSLGTGGMSKWLTPNVGTGKWERYVGCYKLGPNFGAHPLAFIYVVGPQPSTASPLTWYVQSFDILDMSNSGSQALATRMTQLAGSWAVQNLTSAGDVLGQINLNPDGSVRINDGLISVGTKTYIEDGVITSAKIASLDAGKITSGYISGERFRANSITAEKLKVDKALFDKLAADVANVKNFFANSVVATSLRTVTLSATQIQSGVLKSFNERTTFDLLTGKLTFKNGSPSIEFNSDKSAIRRVTDAQSQFIKFASKDGGTYTTIGASRVALDELIGTATFTGIQIQSRSAERGGLIDRIYAYADEFVVDGGGGQVDGFVFKNREALYPQGSGMIGLGRLEKRWKDVYAFDYYVGQNAVSLKEFLDAVRACFQQIAYGGMTQTTYTLIQSKLSSTFNKIQ
ncbi:TPA: hypothetical protein ACGO80_000399 [Streptococcus suis]